jgi:hypothetical protein
MRTGVVLLTWLTVVGPVFAQFSEGFGNFAALAPAGWGFQNNSVMASAAGQWQQGVSNALQGPPAPIGGPTSYALSTFEATGSTTATGSNVSDWMLTPPLVLNNGTTLQFNTTASAQTGGNIFPERLQVRLSTNGTSSNVGTTDTSVGDFTTLLLEINPTLQPNTYPSTWTLQSITLSGLPGPVTGRIGFRHFVTDSGFFGNNGAAIGIDSFSTTANVVPEPTSGGLIALIGLGWWLQRLRQAARRKTETRLGVSSLRLCVSA